VILRVLLVVAASLGVAATPAAGAAREWQEVGTAAGPIVGDGTSVAWTAAPGRAVVVRAGGERLERQAANCPGFVRAVGGRRVLFACDQPKPLAGYPSPVDYAIEPGANRFRVWTDPYSETETFDQLGDPWVAGAFTGYHFTDQRYYNYRTGDTIFASRDPFGPRRFLDPSMPALGRPLCRALWRRTVKQFDVYPRYLPAQVADRWLLQGWMGTSALEGMPLVLRRCGTRRARDLGDGTQARIGSGWVTWVPMRGSEPRGVARALRLRDGHTRYWYVDRHTVIAHTADAIYAAVPIGLSYDPQGYRILRGSLR
jgi:hypothetical protein